MTKYKCTHRFYQAYVLIDQILISSNLLATFTHIIETDVPTDISELSVNEMNRHSLTGIIYEWTQSYGTAVQFAGILSFIAVFAQSLVPFLDMCSKKNKRRQPGIEINLSETEKMVPHD